MYLFLYLIKLFLDNLFIGFEMKEFLLSDHMKFKNICYDLELLGFIDVILITLLDS